VNIHLWSRDPEDEILSTIRELGIGFVPYSPVGRGFLTGKIKKIDDFAANDYRRYSPGSCLKISIRTESLLTRLKN